MNALRRLVRDLAAAETAADLWCAQIQARAIVASDRAASARKRGRKAPRIRQEKMDAATRALNASTIRAAVFARSGGRCEFCNDPYPAEWHHLAPGPLRRKFEGVHTTAAVCLACHRLWHRNDPDVLKFSIHLAERIGAPDIVQANLNRRFQKVTHGV